jgi:hypothetical protein
VTRRRPIRDGADGSKLNFIPGLAESLAYVECSQERVDVNCETCQPANEESQWNRTLAKDDE